MSLADYTTRIKEVSNSLASMSVIVEENELVQICLRGLASKFGSLQTVVCTRENTPSFFDLQSKLLVEENHAGASTSMHADMMLYMEEGRPRGRGGRGGSTCNGGNRQEQDI